MRNKSGKWPYKRHGVRAQRWRSYKKTGGPPGWGNRCKEYCAGCICCEAWKLYDANGRFPTFDEASKVSMEMNNAESQAHVAWTKTEEGQRWVANCERSQARRKLEIAREERNRVRRRTKRLSRKKETTCLSDS